MVSLTILFISLLATWLLLWLKVLKHHNLFLSHWWLHLKLWKIIWLLIILLLLLLWHSKHVLVLLLLLIEHHLLHHIVLLLINRRIRLLILHKLLLHLKLLEVLQLLLSYRINILIFLLKVRVLFIFFLKFCSLIDICWTYLLSIFFCIKIS